MKLCLVIHLIVIYHNSLCEIWKFCVSHPVWQVMKNCQTEWFSVSPNFCHGWTIKPYRASAWSNEPIQGASVTCFCTFFCFLYLSVKWYNKKLQAVFKIRRGGTPDMCIYTNRAKRSDYLPMGGWVFGCKQFISLVL